MESWPSTLPDAVVHTDLQLFDTARRRAERLRDAAIDDAVRAAARGPASLLRALRGLLQRTVDQGEGRKAATTCRS